MVAVYTVTPATSADTQRWIKPGLVDVHSSKYTEIHSEIVFGKKRKLDVRHYFHSISFLCWGIVI